MWFLRSPKLKRETCSRIPFSRQALFLMLHLWSLLDLLHAICRYLNHTSRPHHRRLNLVVKLFLALRASSSVRPEGLRTPVGGHVGSSVLRQHHHSSLSSSFGRNVLFHSEHHSKGGSPLGGESPRPPSSPVHHGVVQCHRGRSKSPQSGDRVGLDPSPGGSRSAGPQMASGDRSVCNLPDREASSVFLTGLRSAGSGNGCSSPALGRSPSLGLSSDRHHKESSSQTEVLEELRVDSHRSVLASKGLVPGPSGTVVRRSHHTVRSKRSSKTAPLPPLPSKSAYASADCMATIKRFARQAGFSCGGWTAYLQ